MGTSVTVIVPTFNERENVAELVARTAVALAGYDAEILFVDDSTDLSLIHISEPTRLRRISYAVFCLKKKNP